SPFTGDEFDRGGDCLPRARDAIRARGVSFQHAEYAVLCDHHAAAAGLSDEGLYRAAVETVFDAVDRDVSAGGTRSCGWERPINLRSSDFSPSRSRCIEPKLKRIVRRCCANISRIKRLPDPAERLWELSLCAESLRMSVGKWPSRF